MKKMILLVPFVAISLLPGCSKPEYNELWTKKTTISVLDDSLVEERIREIKNKKIVKETKLNYISFLSREDTYTYNEHGDLASEYILVKDMKSEGENTTINTYEYVYNPKNLIAQVRKTNENHQTGKITTYDTDYEYDDFKRCIRETKYTESQDGDSRNITSDTVNYYNDDFKTFIKSVTYTYNSALDLTKINTITNTLDDKGYILETSDITESINNSKTEPTNSYTYYTLDKYHCATLVETYSDPEHKPEDLLKKEEAAYYKNNPEKKVGSTKVDYTDGNYHESMTSKYDKYDRLSEESVISFGDIVQYNKNQRIYYDYN